MAEGELDDRDRSHPGSRVSLGGEAFQRLQSETRTIGIIDVQVRLVRRDDPLPVSNDRGGPMYEGWSLELHNAYIDLYNILDPFIDGAARAANIGRFNLRVGHFYLPFGLNLQTDTHGTVLQLANEEDFGFERDWYAGLWGALNPDLNYDCYYLLGSGRDPRFAGQRGLLGARLSLGNRWRNEHGLEGGIALIAGERLAPDMGADAPRVDRDGDGRVRTFRSGPDVRWTTSLAAGTATAAGEIAVGEDDGQRVVGQLYQLDWLHRSRSFGLATQYRRFDRDLSGGRDLRSSLFVEATWYLRNDPTGSFQHWLKFNVEREMESPEPLATRFVLQYYRYW